VLGAGTIAIGRLRKEAIVTAGGAAGVIVTIPFGNVSMRVIVVSLFGPRGRVLVLVSITVIVVVLCGVVIAVLVRAILRMQSCRGYSRQRKRDDDEGQGLPDELAHGRCTLPLRRKGRVNVITTIEPRLQSGKLRGVSTI